MLGRRVLKPPFQRITILGNAGSGKSTAARELADKLGLPVVHLDRLYWGPAWTKVGTEAFRERIRSALVGDNWVCEGNYYRQSFDLRLPRSDLIIWMRTPTSLCLFRAIKRSMLNHPRPDLPCDCIERLDAEFLSFLQYIYKFDRVSRPAIEAERLAIAPNVPVIEARNRKDYLSMA